MEIEKQADRILSMIIDDFEKKGKVAIFFGYIREGALDDPDGIYTSCKATSHVDLDRVLCREYVQEQLRTGMISEEDI